MLSICWKFGEARSHPRYCDFPHGSAFYLETTCKHDLYNRVYKQRLSIMSCLLSIGLDMIIWDNERKCSSGIQ